MRLIHRQESGHGPGCRLQTRNTPGSRDRCRTSCGLDADWNHPATAFPQVRALVRMSRPISRILSCRSRGDHPSGAPITGRLGATYLPLKTSNPTARFSELNQLGLAPGGVYLAATVTRSAGELLPHRFTLTRTPRGEPLAVCSLWHCPARRRGWPLATTVLCGVRTFLDLPEGSAAAARPTHSRTKSTASARLRKSKGSSPQRSYRHTDPRVRYGRPKKFGGRDFRPDSCTTSPVEDSFY